MAIASNGAKLPPFESTAVRPTPCLCSISFGVKGEEVLSGEVCDATYKQWKRRNKGRKVLLRDDRALLTLLSLFSQTVWVITSKQWMGEGSEGRGSREGMRQVMSVFVSLSCPWRTLSLDKQGRGRRPQQPASCQAYLTLTFDLVILTLGQLLHLININHVCNYHLYLIIG